MGSARVDESGKQYDKLEVLRFSHIQYYPGGGKQSFWWCRCKCGREKPIRATELRRKDGKAARSCGECVKIKHGHTTGKQSTEYVSWHGMISRCHTTGCSGYPNYGGCGVKVCERWRKSFADFLADMGLKPSPRHTVDRYPNQDGDYEPGNCRWATKAEQNRNMRTNVRVTIGGRTEIVADWLVVLGLSRTIYYGRRGRGMTPLEALTTRVTKAFYIGTSYVKTPEQKLAAKARAKRALTDEQRAEAIRLVNSGEPVTAVARFFGVGASTVARACGKSR